MHEMESGLTQSIQDFFGGIGCVSKPTKTTAEFRVSSLKELADVIIPHFDNYPLITKKFADYMLFKEIVLLMLKKEHNTLEGLQKIVNRRESVS